MTCRQPPVSPMVCMVRATNQEEAGKEETPSGEDDGEPVVDFGHARLKDPIIGVKDVISNEHGDGAIPAEPMKAPKSMTTAEWERHCVTHLPYHPSCPLCRAARRPNVQHRLSHEFERTIPLLVADYCFVKGERLRSHYALLLPACIHISSSFAAPSW